MANAADQGIREHKAFIDQALAETLTFVQSVISRHIDDLEPALTRHGHRMKDLVEQFEGKVPGMDSCN